MDGPTATHHRPIGLSSTDRMARAGWICGLIGMILTGVGLLLLIGILGLAAVPSLN